MWPLDLRSRTDPLANAVMARPQLSIPMKIVKIVIFKAK